MKTLILNADFTPFDIVHYRKGIILLYCSDKSVVYPVHNYNKVIKDSKGREYPIPSILVLKKYVNVHSKIAPYNKLNVYARDGYLCQYCSKKCNHENITIDHIIPRCKWTQKGTPTRFDNVVTCCKSCNTRKADKTLEQAKMKLMKQPKAMTRGQAFTAKLICATNIPEEWLPYVKTKSEVHTKN